MNYDSIIVSYGDNIFKSDNIAEVPFEYIVDNIKQGSVLIDKIDQIRNTQDKKERNEIKNKLPWFSMCSFDGARKNNSFQSTAFFLYDIDHIENLPERKDEIRNWEYTNTLFTSPSGNGLKLIVKLSEQITSPVVYSKVYEGFSSEIENQFDITLDSATKDPARACFLSYDPDIYSNPDSTPVNINDYYSDDQITCSSMPVKTNKRDDLLSQFDGVEEGNRHYALLKMIGMLKSQTKFDYDFSYQICSLWNQKNNPPFTDKEFNKEFSSIYYSIGNQEEQKAVSPKSTVFWNIDRNKVLIEHSMLIKFLNESGFKKISTVLGSYEYVFIEEPIIDIVSRDLIADFVRRHIEKENPSEKKKILNTLIRQTKDLYSVHVLNNLETIIPNIKQDTVNEAFLYFLNGYVKITADDKKLFDYSTITGELIWKKSIIKRIIDLEQLKKEMPVSLLKSVYSGLEEGEIKDHLKSDPQLLNATEYNPKEDILLTGSEYDRVLGMVTNYEHDWYKSLVCSIGYMAHKYKNPAEAKVIIFCDAEISTGNEANGGTGKSLLCNGLRQFRNVTPIEPKSYRGTSQFKFQSVKYDTDIILFDDIRIIFDFESLFSAITSDLTVEKKFKDSHLISFNESPKIIIATNYTVQGDGQSYERRKHEIEFSNYFNNDHQPIHEFGHFLFLDWDDMEWNRFYVTIIEYIHNYLRYGLVKYNHKNLSVRKIINETNEDFLEFADENFKLDTKLNKAELCESFKQQYTDHKDIKQKTLTIWTKKYAKNKGLAVSEDKSGNKRYIKFNKVTK